jgi:hypothetical protein
MTTPDRVLRDGVCAALELAAKRGATDLESAWQRFTPRQRALVPAGFIDALREETSHLGKQSWGIRCVGET